MSDPFQQALERIKAAAHEERLFALDAPHYSQAANLGFARASAFDEAAGYLAAALEEDA